MVHGKFFGSVKRVAPVEARSCGIFLSFRYFWTAALGGVPMIWKVLNTSSPSTSLRTCSTVFGGL